MSNHDPGSGGVRLVEEAAEKLRDACHFELRNDEISVDALYRYGAALSELAIRLTDLSGCKLRLRMDAFARCHELRDDAGADPHTRIRAAAVALNDFAAALEEAHANASAYHSAIGHIAVQEGGNSA